MSSNAIAINSITWTAITSAGSSAVCWLIREPRVGRVLIDHSSNGTSTLNASKSYSVPCAKEALTRLRADNEDDIYYAICGQLGQDASIVVDDAVFDSSSNSISSENSSNSALTIDGVFIGEWVEIVRCGIIFVNVFTDQNSAYEGLDIQQSSDAINADYHDRYSIEANNGRTFAINPHSRYLRIVYTNGSGAQSIMRLETILKGYSLPTSHSIRDDITEDDDASLVSSIIKVQANDLKQFKNISYSNPMPVNGGLLYPHDLNLTYSNLYGFSGSGIELFEDRWSVNEDLSSTNPKLMLLEFERPMQTSIVGLVTEQGSFSNTVIKFGVSTSPWFTLIDESGDSTPKQFLIAPSIPITLNRILLEFHTSNPVTLTGLNLAKSTNSIVQMQGQTPQGNIVPIGATPGGNQKVTIQEYGDTPSIDAFGRLRVGEPYTILDAKQLYDKQPLLYDEHFGGSATSSHSTVDARVRMNVTASASDFFIRQTKQRMNYQPGKGQEILFTFVASQESGVTKRVGYFSGTGTNFMTPKNGIFFEVNGTSISWNICKNGVTTETAVQDDWNVDKLDGSGLSAITLDVSSNQIGFIDFEALMVGRVRVGFVIDGIIKYCHYFNHANVAGVVSSYISSPNLPLRYDIQSDGTGAGSLDHICTTVMSEGGLEETGVSRSVDTGATALAASVAGNSYVALAIRLKSTHLDLTVLPEFVSMIATTNDDFRWSLHINPTYSGTLTFNDIANSGCQYAIGTTTNSMTGSGIKIDSGYAKAASNIDRRIKTSLRIGSTILEVRDVLALVAMPLNNNASIHGSLTFRELL